MIDDVVYIHTVYSSTHELRLPTSEKVACFSIRSQSQPCLFALLSSFYFSLPCLPLSYVDRVHYSHALPFVPSPFLSAQFPPHRSSFFRCISTGSIIEHWTHAPSPMHSPTLAFKFLLVCHSRTLLRRGIVVSRCTCLPALDSSEVLRTVLCLFRPCPALLCTILRIWQDRPFGFLCWCDMYK
ncbi:hypothetical protein L226DRAFT_331971 [Lentinus tigrinus ALCF2SS1-7]|uniref:uncharacterized protein n=1 Tax=Lentinus tigrinus ALCF2SS1-7 TaxID=1328758 RepID=UPI001165ED66|nr:hypothetical protein L226DRAFT_331971 [Lentinus tigrinus ALCF2SS1-7]